MSSAFETAELGFRTARKRGHRAGSLYRHQGYGKVHGHYPSNPYHASDPRAAEYDIGYEEAVNGKSD